MNLVLEPDSAMVDDSEVQNQTGVGQRRITWTGPLGLVVGRSAPMVVAPALVAGILALRGRPTRGARLRLGGPSAALWWISAAWP